MVVWIGWIRYRQHRCAGPLVTGVFQLSCGDVLGERCVEIHQFICDSVDKGLALTPRNGCTPCLDSTWVGDGYKVLVVTSGVVHLDEVPQLLSSRRITVRRGLPQRNRQCYQIGRRRSWWGRWWSSWGHHAAVVFLIALLIQRVMELRILLHTRQQWRLLSWFGILFYETTSGLELMDFESRAFLSLIDTAISSASWWLNPVLFSSVDFVFCRLVLPFLLLLRLSVLLLPGGSRSPRVCCEIASVVTDSAVVHSIFGRMLQGGYHFPHCYHMVPFTRCLRRDNTVVTQCGFLSTMLLVGLSLFGFSLLLLSRSVVLWSDTLGGSLVDERFFRDRVIYQVIGCYRLQRMH